MKGGESMDVCVIGTGYVGLVTGTCLAHIGYHVICTDIDIHKIEQLNNGILTIFEPGLEKLIQENLSNHRLEFSCDMNQAVEKSTIIFIAVGTPPDMDGGADLSYVFRAAYDIAHALNGYKVIVDKSTVPVGTAMKVKDIIEKNKKNDIPFSVVANPEFLKEGSAIDDVFNADRIVIGVDEDRSKQIMGDLYKPLNLPVFFTDIISAEIIKYASNAFLATKISFINEIANICERLGGDVTKVAQGMGMDRRISPYFLNAGLGYGGSCFPKDVNALLVSSQKIGYDFNILKAVVKVNNEQRERMVEKILNCIKGIENPCIGVLGLAFKPNTDDVREAPSLDIIKKLKERAKIKAYDPVAMIKAHEVIPDIEYCSNLYKACEGVDALIIVTEWDEFKNIDLDEVRRNVKSPFIIDGRNIFDPRILSDKGFTYISIGRN